MKDYILRATAGDGAIRLFIADSTQTVAQAHKLHNTSAVMSVALGRLLTGAALMGSMLKNEDDVLTIQINGDGPAGKLTVTSDSHSRVKGCLNNPTLEIPIMNGQYDVPTAIGFGTLTVIKDLGLKDPYVGQVDLMSSEIAEDLTYYFAKSEQVPSAVGLGVIPKEDGDIEKAGGLIVQIMPDTDDAIIDKIENKLKEYGNIATLLDHGMTPEDILEHIAGELNPVILDKTPMEYYCDCSREKVEKALISIGKKEITSIIEEDHEATLHCHFCNKDYHFDEEELKEILERASR